MLCPDLFLEISLSTSGSCGAFCGAIVGSILTFVLGLLAYFVTKRFELLFAYKRNLEQLDSVLLNHISDLGAYKTLINSVDMVARSGNLAVDRIITFHLAEDFDREIKNKRLLTSLLTYKVTIRRLNYESEILNRTLNRIEDIFISKNRVDDANLKTVLQKIAGHKENFSKVTERAIESLAIVRILNGSVSGNYKILKRFIMPDIYHRKIDEVEIKTEVEKLRKMVSEIHDSVNK